MDRSSGPRPRTSIASHTPASATSKAMYRHSPAPARSRSFMRASNPAARPAFHAALTRLELVACANADRPGPSRDNLSACAAAAGRLPAEIDPLVEQILDESFDIPRGPVETSEYIDERRGVQPSLELVGIDVFA